MDFLRASGQKIRYFKGSRVTASYRGQKIPKFSISLQVSTMHVLVILPNFFAVYLRTLRALESDNALLTTANLERRLRTEKERERERERESESERERERV